MNYLQNQNIEETIITYNIFDDQFKNYPFNRRNDIQLEGMQIDLHN